MTTPKLADLIAERGITGHAAAILGAVWRGKGMSIMSGAIFDAMYSDDPDGGPSPTRMYAALKRGLARLECQLDGSGVSVVEAGYRCGYRLTLSVVS
ncbi:hypothetical protein NKH60_18610 [Mesorhizobium sp. M1006]|uniref:hypothetical protein n=1 Tax=Mesorhizobium sp. M1006 TaxID=2957048 RepID=UPI00333682B3